MTSLSSNGVKAFSWACLQIVVAEWAVPGECWAGWQCWRGGPCLKAHSDMVKKVHVLNTDMKRPFSRVFSLHVNTFSKEISTVFWTEGALCCWQSPQEHWSASHITIQPADQCALQLPSAQGLLCLSGVQPVTPKDHLSLCSRRQYGICTVFHISKQYFAFFFPVSLNPAESGKPAAESEVKGKWWVQQQLKHPYWEFSLR